MTGGADDLVDTVVQSALAYAELRQQIQQRDAANRAARQQMRELREQRNEAFRRLYHDQRLTSQEIEDVLIEAFHRRGLGDDQIAGLGISNDSVLRVVGQPRRKGPQV